MKKIYLIIAICSSALIANSQIFWTEDFGTGCNTGQLASAYTTGINGAWAVTSTGTNDTKANVFFVSAAERGMGIGACGAACGGTNSRTLHLGNVAVPAIGLTADGGASYNSGGLCSPPFNICVVTNTRAESPVINCSGKTGITISFAYMEGGDAALDDATLWYSADGGVAWSLLDNPAKTVVCGGGQGTWTAYSFSLPVSADNNPTVKIGFNWTNNDDGTGTDPSFAVDDITLSTVATGIADLSSSSLQVFADGNNVVVRSSDLVKLIGVYDVLGRMITSSFSLENNSINMESQPSGIYFVRVEVKGQVYTKKVFIK